MSEIQFNVDNMYDGSTVAILNGISSMSSVEVLNAIVAGTRLKLKDKEFIKGLEKAGNNEEALMGIPIKEFAMAALDILNIEKYSGNSVRVREMIQCGLKF